MITFASKYTLRNDIPTHKAGSVLRWDGMTEFFYFMLPGEQFKADRNGPRYTVQQIQDSAWFESASEIRPFIPKFPDEKKIEEFADLHASCRLVNSVDVCRALNAMIADKGFQHRLYEFYREQYNAFHGIQPKKSKQKARINGE